MGDEISLTGQEESGPADKSMMALEDADRECQSTAYIMFHSLELSLVVCVAHPGDRGAGSEKHGNVGENAKGDNRVVFGAVVLEHHDDFHDEPCNTGHGTAGVNSSQVLCT